MSDSLQKPYVGMSSPGRNAGGVPNVLPEGESADLPTGLAAGGTSYERPRLFRLGSVIAVTKGSSSSGSHDANSQFYW
jgi:hypothetical protein